MDLLKKQPMTTKEIGKALGITRSEVLKELMKLPVEYAGQKYDEEVKMKVTAWKVRD